MTLMELLQWMYPNWGMVGLSGLWIAGGAFLSFLFNHQSVPNKIKNALVFGGLLASTGLWLALLRILHGEPAPFRAMGVMVGMFVYAELGDWLSYGLYHLTGRVDRRLIEWAFQKAAKDIASPSPLRAPAAWKLPRWNWVLVTLALIVALFACSQSSNFLPGATRVQVMELGETPFSDGKGGGGEAPQVLCINNTPTCILPLPEGTATAVPTVTALPQPSTTPIQGVNLLTNPGFEKPYHNEANGLVANGWSSWYLIAPVPKALKPPSDSLNYGRFLEMNGCTVGNTDTARIHGGKECQKWFSFYNQSFAGVYQTINAPVDTDCTISAFFHAWSNDEVARDPHTSLQGTDDDKSAATFLIGYDPTGGTNPQASTVVWKMWGVLPSNPYLPYAPVGSAKLTYEATGNTQDIYDPPSREFVTNAHTQDTKLTMFFFSWRIWGLRTNDSYLDDAAVKCAVSLPPTTSTKPSATTTVPTNTPAPGQTATPGPTIQASPTAVGSLCPVYPCLFSADLVYQIVSNGLNVRSAYKTTAPIVGSYRFAQEVVVHCIAMIDEKDTEEWGSSDECDVASHWFALFIGNTRYARELEVMPPPEGY